MTDDGPYVRLQNLVRESLDADQAEALLTSIKLHLGAEKVEIPVSRSIALSDIELLALVKACNGNAQEVARRLAVSPKQVSNKLAWLVRRRH